MISLTRRLVFTPLLQRSPLEIKLPRSSCFKVWEGVYFEMCFFHTSVMLSWWLSTCVLSSYLKVDSRNRILNIFSPPEDTSCDCLQHHCSKWFSQLPRSLAADGRRTLTLWKCWDCCLLAFGQIVTKPVNPDWLLVVKVTQLPLEDGSEHTSKVCWEWFEIHLQNTHTHPPCKKTLKVYYSYYLKIN